MPGLRYLGLLDHWYTWFSTPNSGQCTLLTVGLGCEKLVYVYRCLKLTTNETFLSHSVILIIVNANICSLFHSALLANDYHVASCFIGLLNSTDFHTLN